MLPGFRFLVAAIVFSFSIIVFGLGAAALFRAAHEQFASSSSWRATPETSFTAFLPQAEPLRPMIAMLRVEPATPEMASTSPAPAEVQTDVSSTDAVPDAPSPAETPLPAQPTAPEIAPAALPVSADLGASHVAMTETTDATPPDAPSMIAESVTPASPQPDSVTISLTVAPPPTVMAAVVPQEPTPAAAEAQTPASTVPPDAPATNQPVTATGPKPDAIATKLASLGDQASTSERRASLKIASIQLRRSLAKKRLAKARLAKERLAEARHARQRQMAQRAHAARAVATQQQQQAADPFAQPQGFGQSAFGQQTAQRTR